MDRFVIRCKPNYFAGDVHKNDREFSMISVADGLPVVLASEQDAALICEMLNAPGDGPYMLAHNQFAAPEYHFIVTRSHAPSMSLRNAMHHLCLQDDFSLDGTRKPVLAPTDYTARPAPAGKEIQMITHTITAILADAKKARLIVTRFSGKVNGAAAFKVEGKPGLFSKNGLMELIGVYG